MSGRYARMSFSEQCLRPTMSLHNGRFLLPCKLHICSVQSAPFNVHAIRTAKAPCSDLGLKPR